MATSKYKTLCARIFDCAEDTIKSAVAPAVEEHIKQAPAFTAYIEANSDIITRANALVAALSPLLKVSGPITTTTRFSLLSPNRRDNSSSWFMWGSFSHRPLVDFEIPHKAILSTEGGALSGLLKERGITPNNDARVILNTQTGIDKMFDDNLPLLAKLHWAINQTRILDSEFTEWTKQFRDYTPKRAIDLSHYFSPVFASFSSSAGAKVFSSRPRVDDYIPMSKDLAIILTTARSSRSYANTGWYV